MKRILLCIVLLTTVTAGLTRGQTPVNEQGSLAKLYLRLRLASDDNDRLRINDSIKSYIEELIDSGEAFSHSFPNLRYLGQVASSDSLIKIITWNLVLENVPGRYFCYIIRRPSRGKPYKVYNLTHPYEDLPLSADTVFTVTDWYGALYYDMRPFRIHGKQCWTLLGINFRNQLLTRKIIDVMSFDGEDNLILGMKCFSASGALEYRHILEYSSSATISLRFTSDKTIVFDHLAPLPPTGIDNRIYYGPDYSFDAFNLKNGLWTLSLNVDARNRQK